MKIEKFINYTKIKISSLGNPFYFTKFNNDETKSKFLFFMKNGFLDLGKILSDEECLIINNKINMMIEKKDAKFLQSQNIWKIEKCDNFIDVINKVLNKNLFSILKNYFKCKYFISDFDVRRVLASSYEDVLKFGNSNSDWHKDTRGKQIKMMIYLTPVTKTDSYFSLIPGTQKNITLNFKESRFEEGKVNTKKEVKFLSNEKGRAIIFDTNVIHRLNRNAKSNIRDTMTINFTAGQYLKQIYHGSLDNIQDAKLKKLITDNSLLEKRI